MTLKSDDYLKQSDAWGRENAITICSFIARDLEVRITLFNNLISYVALFINATAFKAGHCTIQRQSCSTYTAR